MVFQYLAVAAMAASPVGEELVAIPMGIAFGLPLPAVIVTAIFFNVLPVFLIIIVFRKAEQSVGPIRWLVKLRNQKFSRILDRFGMPGVMVVTPWLGVYAATVTLEILGMSHSRIFISILASLVIYAVIIAAVSVAVLG
jgi:uncharacterized membrane protein